MDLRSGLRRSSPRWMPLIAAVAFSALSFPGHAATPGPETTLASTDQVVTWSGSTDVGGPTVAPVLHTPETCAVAAIVSMCDSFELTVDLPTGTFPKPGDGLHVAIRWETNFLQWNLFVYGPDGSLAASGAGVDSNAQAVLIPQPSNGRYTVLAAPASAEPMAYAGEARVVIDRRARMDPGTILAPRLWTIPPYDFHIACSEPDPEATPTNGRCADVAPLPSNPTGWRFGGAWANSCYSDEASGPTGLVRRCLRFTNNIRNAGDGPLILRATLVDGLGEGRCHMQQVILRADGSEGIRDAGACEFHAAHGHFHYLNTSQYSMIPASNDPTVAPDLSAQPIAAGRKLGYCLVDIDFWASANDPSRLSPRGWSFPTCDMPDPAQSRARGTLVQEMGISPGWGDIYTWDLPGQYLDITDVPDGTYDVVSVANPDCTLQETAPGLEASATRIRLHGETVTVLAEFEPFAVPGCAVPLP